MIVATHSHSQIFQCSNLDDVENCIIATFTERLTLIFLSPILSVMLWRCSRDNKVCISLPSKLENSVLLIMEKTVARFDQSSLSMKEQKAVSRANLSGPWTFGKLEPMPSWDIKQEQNFQVKHALVFSGGIQRGPSRALSASPGKRYAVPLASTRHQPCSSFAGVGANKPERL